MAEMKSWSSIEVNMNIPYLINTLFEVLVSNLIHYILTTLHLKSVFKMYLLYKLDVIIHKNYLLGSQSVPFLIK